MLEGGHRKRLHLVGLELLKPAMIGAPLTAIGLADLVQVSH
jgi:hypothetical protein